MSVIGAAINHYDATHQPPAITPAEMQDMIHEAAREALRRSQRHRHRGWPFRETIGAMLLGSMRD